jgi:hypothetical protein
MGASMMSWQYMQASFGLNLFDESLYLPDGRWLFIRFSLFLFCNRALIPSTKTLHFHCNRFFKSRKFHPPARHHFTSCMHLMAHLGTFELVGGTEPIDRPSHGLFARDRKGQLRSVIHEVSAVAHLSIPILDHIHQRTGSHYT